MLKIEVTSPVGYLFEGECEMAVVPCVAGEIGVMQDHEAFVSLLKAGKIVIYGNKQEIIKEIEVASGFVEISNGKKLIILVDE